MRSRLCFLIGILLACCASGLVGQSNPKSPIVESGHSAGITGVAFSSDGKTLVSVGGLDKDNIKIWDSTTGVLRKTIDCNCLPSGVAFGPNGREIAVVGPTNISVFDVGSGELVLSVGGMTATANDVLYTPDGTFLVTSAFDGWIHIWSPLSGKEVRKFSANSESISSLAIAPDGRTLASGSWDKTVRLWDITAGKEIRKFVGHKAWVTSLAFSSDGKQIVSGDQETTIGVWDVATGKRIQDLTDENLIGSSIDSVAFCPRGLVGDTAVHCVIAGNLSNLVLLDVDTGRWKQMRFKHMISALAVSPDESLLAVGSPDRSITILDLKTKKEIVLKGK